MKQKIEYLLCSEVDDRKTYEAAEAGFCDYVMPFKMSEEEFSSRFWGPEGNQREFSYIAVVDNKPIGLVLGGIRDFDGVKTMRCGMLGVGEEYRGKGVAQELMNLHMAAARSAGCDRLFLEVINGNDRAVSFYKKLGYVGTYDIKYFSYTRKQFKMINLPPNTELRDSSLDEVKAIRRALQDVHIHWQREMESLDTDYRFKVLEQDGSIAAVIAYNKTVIPFLYVLPPYRNQKLGTALLHEALREMDDEGKIILSFTNNAAMEMFSLATEGQRADISQFEMYRAIKE